ncbi:MAG: hypothetical protein Q8Q96_00755 [bacterium]|nr:hypothetical protein [bacterium]
MANSEARAYIPKSPFGHGLSAHELRKRDVEVFSRMHGISDPEAARALIDRGVDGREIGRRRGGGLEGNIRRSRASVAREYFEEIIGQPISTGE